MPALVLALVLALLLAPAHPALAAAGQAAPAPAAAAPEPEAPDVLYPDLAETAPGLSARAAVLMDAETGALLYARRAHERRPPASTTKILTAVLALRYGHPDDVVVISRRAAATPGSSMGVRAGERYRLEDLLYGLMLPSGNDAAVAIAEHISGSVGRFAALMNEHARRIGMTWSRFANPHGLPHPGHLTTAYDLALLARSAMAEPGFAGLGCAKRYQACELESGRRLGLTSTNRLLWSYAYVEAGKTGTTSSAGRCLVIVASRQGHRLIAVVLNAPDRWGDARRLLEWGFQRFRLVRVGREGEQVARVPVVGGTVGAVTGVLAGDLLAVVPEGDSARARLRLELPEQVAAPLPPRARLGRAELLVDGQPVAAADVVALREVGRITPVRQAVALLLQLLRWVYGPVG